MMLLDTLRKRWYDREDYIRVAGDDLLQRLKRQGAFEGLSSDSFVSINPSSGEYIVTKSAGEAVGAGFRRWCHPDFYCSRINNPPGSHNKFSDSELLRRGEDALRRLKEERQLEDIAGSDLIAIEPVHGHYVMGGSWEETITRARETFGHDRVYVRPIDDRLIPSLGF